MTTNTMGRDEAGKAIRKRAMEGCPLARELLILRGMCSCQGDEKSVDDAEDRYLELAVLRDAVPALQAEIETLRAEVEAWRELSDHVRVGACKAIWPDRYIDERIRDVAAALKRAERLAEALRELEGREQRVTVIFEEQR